MKDDLIFFLAESIHLTDKYLAEIARALERMFDSPHLPAEDAQDAYHDIVCSVLVKIGEGLVSRDIAKDMFDQVGDIIQNSTPGIPLKCPKVN